jgi:hypothetical protein
MKQLINIVSLLLLTLIFNQHVFAQEDSISDINNDKSPEALNYQQSIRYLDRNMNNENRLFKIAVPVFSAGYKKIGYAKELDHYYKYFAMELILAYEQKISPSFSYYVNNISTFSKSDVTGFEIVNEPEDFNRFNNAFDIGTRWYFLMNHRIKQGLSGNNLYGNYIAVAIEGLSSLQVSPNTKYNFYDPDGYKLYIGSQSRLNNWAYLDISAFIRADPKLAKEFLNVNLIYTAGLNLKIGLVKNFK